MGKDLITLEHISKSYDGQLILDDLNLSIYENSFVTLLGPSGCGKTTTLRIIGGFETPDKGRVIFDGKDITSLSPNKRQLNTVFQKYALFTHMTVAENIAFGLKIKNKSDSYIKDKIKYALKLVNLEGYENRSPESLSGGQQQRIAIARAIVKNSPILVLDEATSFSDAENEYLIQQALNELMKNKTVIMIAHRLSTIMNADNILVVEDGKLVESGKFNELLEKNGRFCKLWENYNAANVWKLKGRA